MARSPCPGLDARPPAASPASPPASPSGRSPSPIARARAAPTSGRARGRVSCPPRGRTASPPRTPPDGCRCTGPTGRTTTLRRLERGGHPHPHGPGRDRDGDQVRGQTTRVVGAWWRCVRPTFQPLRHPPLRRAEQLPHRPWLRPGPDRHALPGGVVGRNLGDLSRRAAPPPSWPASSTPAGR
jgi:hypothetical protein